MSVVCTSKISKTCIYGASEFDVKLPYKARCNYLLCTGHSRGCSPKECDKYVQIDKEHPREESVSKKLWK